MLAGAWIAWERQEPFISDLEARRVSDAGPWIAATSPGTALVFPVNDADPEVTFLAMRAANVIRAGVPPGRIRDVVVVVPEPAPGAPTSPTREALSRVTLADVTRATAAGGGRHLDVLLAPFDRGDVADAARRVSPWTRVSTGVFLADGDLTPVKVAATLRASSPVGIASATVIVLVLVSVVGYGWARATTRRPLQSLALAPAFGLVALMGVATALERVGLPLSGGRGAGWLVTSVAGTGGYLAWLILERRPRADTAPQVDEQPGQ
jgi:hypothetical protein